MSSFTSREYWSLVLLDEREIPMSTVTGHCGCGRYGPPVMSRREMLERSGLGFGTLALTWLLSEQGMLFAGEEKQGIVVKGNSRVKSVILLYMGGGPSHVDTWDPKTDLQKLQGKDVPESIGKNVPMHMRLRLKNL